MSSLAAARNEVRAGRPASLRPWSRGLGTLAALFALACVIAHVAIARRYMTATGPLLVLDHGFDVFAPLLLLALAAGTGEAVLRRMGYSGQAVERLLFAVALGTGINATALLAVLAVAGVNGASMAVTLLALVLVCRRELLRIPRLLWDAAREVAGEYSASGRWLVAVPSCLAAAAILLLALLPPLGWDSLAYHIEVPREWLASGRIALPPDNLHAAFVGVVHFLYLPLLYLGSLAGPAVLNAFFALLLALAVWVAGRELFDRSVATWAALVLWASPVLVLVAGTPRVDVTLTFFLFLSQYALIKGMLEPRPPRMRWLSGALLGIAVGVKALALLFAVALAPLVLWSVLRSRTRAAAWGAGLLGYFGIVLAVSAPWLIKKALLVGAPSYPALSPPLLEPWLRTIAPREAGPALARAAEAVIRQERLPFDLRDFFLRPRLLTPEGEGVAYIANPLFTLSLLGLMDGRRAARMLLLLGPALLYGVGVLVVGRGYTNLRYLIPAIPQFTLAAAVGLHVCGAWIRSRVARRAAALVPAGAAFLVALAPLWRVAGTGALAFAAGATSRAGVLEGFPPVAGNYEMAEWANRALPADSRTVMIADGRQLYFRRPTMSDDTRQNWTVLHLRAEAGSCLREFGLTHVLVNERAMHHDEEVGANRVGAGFDEFPAFAARCLTVLHRSSDFTLYAIRSR